eukprot:GHVS01095293.1.p1 GENE.GHVS01095293.1~~GHVS01095293.1.p1  ORF type:complete len:298 (-),score=41.95 GHVS01095293.1:248-1141(-)
MESQHQQTGQQAHPVTLPSDGSTSNGCGSEGLCTGGSNGIDCGDRVDVCSGIEPAGAVDEGERTTVRKLPLSAQVRAIMTLLRNRTTTRADFVFQADRIIRLVVEYSLCFLPHQPKVVTTPTGAAYDGVVGLHDDKLCAVSLVRAGESMEGAVSSVCHNVAIGKILFTFKDTTESEWNSSFDHEPTITYVKLPKDIGKRQILLLDPVIGRGWSVIAALHLLSKLPGVQVQQLTLVSILTSRQGVRNILSEFPGLTIVTAEIDPDINDAGFVVPGIGNFGDRYFGTEPQTQHQQANKN